MTPKSYVIVVDDKRYGRDAAAEVMRRHGYADEQIKVARYGDEALKIYKTLLEEGKKVDLVLTDYHMDVVHKPKEDGIRWNKNETPVILDGAELARKILEVDAKQKIIIASAGLSDEVMNDAQSAGANAVLYKRRVETRKFDQYVDAIGHVLETGTIPEHILNEITHRRRKAEHSL